MAASSQAVVELRDIAPTLLDFAGLSTPGAMDGKSLRPCLQDGVCQIREYLHGEHSGGEISNHYIVAQGEKYIWFSQTGQEQYFDLRSDPGEERDLIHEPKAQERIDRLRKALIRELQGREEGYTHAERLIAGRKPLTVLSTSRDT